MLAIDTRRKAGKRDFNIAREEHEIAKAGLASETEIAHMKDRGFEREEKAAQSQIDAMEKQLKLGEHLSPEEKQAYKDKIAAAKFELGLSKERHALERQGIAARLNVSRLESEAASAAARGDLASSNAKSLEAQKIMDAENYRQRLAENRGKYGPDQAKAKTNEQETEIQAARTRAADDYRKAKGRELEEGRLGLSYNADDHRRLRTMQDQDKFRSAFNEAKKSLNYQDPKLAAQIAMQQTRQEIIGSAGGPVVSSLARIGLGGGVSDPVLTVQQRIAVLTEKMNETLGRIEKQGTGGGNVPGEDYWSNPE